MGRTGEACVSAEICVSAVQSPVFQRFDKDRPLTSKITLNEILIFNRDISATKMSKILSQGVKIRAQTSKTLYSSPWEDYVNENCSWIFGLFSTVVYLFFI